MVAHGWGFVAVEAADAVGPEPRPGPESTLVVERGSTRTQRPWWAGPCSEGGGRHGFAGHMAAVSTAAVRTASEDMAGEPGEPKDDVGEVAAQVAVEDQ